MQLISAFSTRGNTLRDPRGDRINILTNSIPPQVCTKMHKNNKRIIDLLSFASAVATVKVRGVGFFSFTETRGDCKDGA